ncbi:MAG TPA: hypothetical protein DEF02_06230, partial [Clostridiales bacterium]|nr:hypothetical protein [Clostridiales bacterium]
KFCGTQSGMSFVADLRSRLAISGFAITNANDTESNSNRRPKVVRIWGSNSKGSWPSSDYNGKTNAGNTPEGKTYSGDWEIVYDSSNINIPIDNDIRHEYAFTGNKTYKYQYYWVYISSVGHVQGSNADAQNIIQFAEFDFLAAGEDVGGVVGYAQNSSIEQVTNTAQIVGSSNVGGIAGEAVASTSLTNAKNSGTILGGSIVGGVAGYADNSTISGAENIGDVWASAPTEPSDIPTTSGINKLGVYLGGIVGWSKDATIKNCFNNAQVSNSKNLDGSDIANSDFVGGIVGYAWGGNVLYCASLNNKPIHGANEVGGIVGVLNGASLSYCYFGGKIEGWWNDASAKLDFICGFKNNGTLENSWKLPTAANGEIGSRKYNNAGYEIAIDGFKLEPQVNKTNTVNKKWADILTQNIDGFKVYGDIDIGKYFLSRKGESSSEYLTPSKVENGNPTNAADRSNTATFTVTAWYGANTNSDIYCSREQIKIDNSTGNVYNGNVRGFERANVNPPLASGKVYGVVFDYSNANVTPIESFICAFGADGNKIANSTNPYQVGTYDTTVFIKIGDVIVGKKCGVVYEITQETINIEWEWTDGNQSTLFSRIGTGDGIQFVYNKAEQGLGSVTFGYNTNLFYTAAEYMFTSSGNLKYTNASSNAYSRTYTLNDTRNFKIHSTNTDADLSGTTVTFEWIIRRNKLTIENRWVRADFGKDSTIYTFEYNAAHQGLLATDGITYIVENDTTGKSHEIYSWVLYIDNHANTINVGKYTRSIYVNDQTNYVIAYTNSYVGNGTAKLSGNKGVSVNDTQSSVTYSWQILAYNILDNFNSDSSKTKVWFGANTDVIVGNQLTSVITGTIRGGSSVSVDYYPLQYAQNGVQKVLIYGQNTTEVQHYLPENFIIYVRYNDGTIAQLGSNEYTLSNLRSPTDKNPTPIPTSVTASGKGNFAGKLSKYYTVLYSDFGWKSDKNPSSANWGSEDNPYVIDRPEYLLRLSQIVNGKDKAWNSIANTAYCYAPQSTATAQNATYKGAHFLVTANIDMSDYVSTDGLTNFLPVGDGSANGERPFSATFDGGNNEIKYIYNIGYFVNKANPSGEEKYDYVGLFGY